MERDLPDCSNFYPDHICKKCIGCIKSKKLDPKMRLTDIEDHIKKFNTIINELSAIKDKFKNIIIFDSVINDNLILSCENDISIFNKILSYLSGKNNMYASMDHRLVVMIYRIYKLSHGHARNFSDTYSPFYISANSLIENYCNPEKK